MQNSVHANEQENMKMQASSCAAKADAMALEEITDFELLETISGSVGAKMIARLSCS